MYGPKHPLCKQAFVPWANEVKKVTNGRVKVTMFYSNALFKPKDALDAISSRVGDIGIVLPVYASESIDSELGYGSTHGGGRKGA